MHNKMSAILVIGLLAAAVVAHAAPVTHGLPVKSTSGPESGTAANGYFAYGDNFLSGGGGW